MPFALDSSPELSEISDAINYLLANFGSGVTADPNTGQITGPTGNILSYLYKYLAVKYADSFDGSVNFSNSPTSRLYYGLRNTDDPVESTNPADYIWYKVDGGFGTTKFLWYQTGGGRQVDFAVAIAAPNSYFIQAPTDSIDLDVVTGNNGKMYAMPSIYIWTSTSTPPTRPSTTSTYTWATGVISSVPAGWSSSIPAMPSGASYLWQIIVPLIESINVTTSTLDWTNTSYPITAISANGATGPRTSTGYLYYALASLTTPSTPTASGYNYVTGQFSSLTTNWSTDFSAPAATDTTKFWACYYSVSEATFGGVQTVTISSPFNWTNFNGLVTFTNLETSSGTTFIDGGNIITNTIVANKLAAGTATIASGATFSLGAGSSILGYSAAGVFGSTNSSYLGMLGYSTNNTIGVAGAAYGSTYGVGGVFGRATSSGLTDFYSLIEIGARYYAGNFTYRAAGGSTISLQSILSYQDSGTSAYYGGVFANNANSTGGYIAISGYDFYASGGGTNYGPFTGAHDALMEKSYTLEPGDIVADNGFVIKSGISNTITQVVPCSSANQAGSIGVFVGIFNDHAPYCMSETIDGILVIKPEYEPLLEANNIIAVNAVGEGQINVCGENGDIQIGDLIVSSSTVGKGMKQTDDCIRSYTVAKSRESVTFSSPSEIKQIACIYLGG